MILRFPPEITKNTLVDFPRLRVLEEQARLTAHLGGSVAEVGVYKGGTAFLLASLTQGAAGEAGRHLFLFDTFAGMPAVSAHDLHKEGDFSDTSLNRVAALLHDFKDLTLVQGLFPGSAGPDAQSAQYSLVHLDVDIYTSVRDCLEFFAPRMLPGGMIILDDYLEPNCPGAKLATDEWCAKHGQVVKPTCQSQALIQF